MVIKLIQIPEEMKTAINLEEEMDKELVTYANKEKKVLLALIAPYTPVRVSPVEKAGAQLGLSEEFAVEAVINHIKETVPESKELILLLNSPGGWVHSSYKIAKLFAESFDSITVCIPHMAASGGTLVALTGKKIIMGPLSHLSPIDIQLNYQGFPVSVNNMTRSLIRLSEYFSTKRAEEAPYPWKALADKLDPIIFEELDGIGQTMRIYATEILEKSKFEKGKIPELVDILTVGCPNHTFVINYERAKQYGLPVEKSSEHKELWALMKKWLGKYVLQAEDKHFVRFIIPKVLIDREEKGR